MAKRKKTWVETYEFTHPADDCELIDYLVFAVYTTCKRLGWDMGVTRQSETFRKIEAWLPSEYANVSQSNVDVYFDSETPGKLIRGEIAPIATVPSETEIREGQVFLSALNSEIARIAGEWALKHGEAGIQHVRYLLSGKREETKSVTPSAADTAKPAAGAAPDAPSAPTSGAALGDGQGEKDIPAVQHLAWLRQNIAEYFNLDELRTLCFDMGIKHENLAASTLDGMARELVDYCKRTGKIRDLVAKLTDLRPNVSWEARPE